MEENKVIRKCSVGGNSDCYNLGCQDECQFKYVYDDSVPEKNRICPVTNATCHNPKCQIVTEIQDTCEFKDYPFLKKKETKSWIKINAENGLPNYDEYVLWYTFDGNYFVEALDKDGNDWLSLCTHWMPLPSPPTA